MPEVTAGPDRSGGDAGGARAGDGRATFWTVAMAGRRRGRLVAWGRRHIRVVVYSSALAFYLLGVWLHIPYGGGHIYSDIVTVFQGRECSSVCNVQVPYLQVFVEYPVITSMFMYAMGVLGSLLSGDLLTNYYYFTAAFLVVPTLLLVREMLKLAEMRGRPREKVLWYFIVTPTFAYMVLLNWYVIGVFFAVAGLRRFLEGRVAYGGVLLGLSAASNLVTAIPALGLLLASKTMRERVVLLCAGLGTYALINLPFIVLAPQRWYEAFNYTYNWYIENSWIQVFTSYLFSPVKHYVPPVAFAAVIAGMLWLRFRKGVDDPIVLAFLAMFGYVFSTYIYPPQLNLTLLPFFVLLPVAGYLEFMAFDTANALIAVLGFSQALLPLGITYSFNAFNRFSFLWWVEVVRSFWVGKLMVLNRIPAIQASAPWGKRRTGARREKRPLPPRRREEVEPAERQGPSWV